MSLGDSDPRGLDVQKNVSKKAKWDQPEQVGEPGLDTRSPVVPRGLPLHVHWPRLWHTEIQNKGKKRDVKGLGWPGGLGRAAWGRGHLGRDRESRQKFARWTEAGGVRQAEGIGISHSLFSQQIVTEHPPDARDQTEHPGYNGEQSILCSWVPDSSVSWEPHMLSFPRL